jgi:hypothetical protein
MPTTPSVPTDILQWTLDLLILKTLSMRVARVDPTVASRS